MRKEKNMIKMYDPVAVFEYDSVKYCIVIVNGFINFYKYIDNKLSEALSEKDIKLLLGVHKALIINKDNSIHIKDEFIDDKQFQIWYDTSSTLYFWYEIKNGNLCDVEEKYNTILNLKYNNTSMFAIEREIFDWEAEERAQQERRKKEQELAEKKIRRNIKIGTIVVCATIIGSVSFLRYSDTKIADKLRQSLFSYETENSTKELSLEESIEQIKNQKYDYNDIQRAIDENEFMTDEEKELLKSLKFYFDENHEYIDTDMLGSRLLNLKFEYEYDSPDPTIMGEYSPTENTIYLYNGDKLSDIDIRVVIHEILHVMQYKYTGRFSLELSNEVATRELLRQMTERNLIQDTSIFENDYKYNSEYGIGYDPCLSVQYSLYELIPPEQIRQYQFYGDDRIIINALEQIDFNGENVEYNSYKEQASRARAISLLNAIDELFVLNENDVHVMEYSDEKFNRIYNMMDTYYVQKNGYSINQSISADIMNIDVHNIGKAPIPSEKLTALYYTFSALAGDENEGEISKYLQSNFGKKVYVLPKTYFSDDHAYAKVMFDTPELMIVDVNEEAQNVFECKQKWVKEMMEKMEKESTSYLPDYTDFYYYETPTERIEPTRDATTNSKDTDKSEDKSTKAVTEPIEPEL